MNFAVSPLRMRIDENQNTLVTDDPLMILASIFIINNNDDVLIRINYYSRLFGDTPTGSSVTKDLTYIPMYGVQNSEITRVIKQLKNIVIPRSVRANILSSSLSHLQEKKKCNIYIHTPHHSSFHVRRLMSFCHRRVYNNVHSHRRLYTLRIIFKRQSKPPENEKKKIIQDMSTCVFLEHRVTSSFIHTDAVVLQAKKKIQEIRERPVTTYYRDVKKNINQTSAPNHCTLIFFLNKISSQNLPPVISSFSRSHRIDNFFFLKFIFKK